LPTRSSEHILALKFHYPIFPLTGTFIKKCFLLEKPHNGAIYFPLIFMTLLTAADCSGMGFMGFPHALPIVGPETP